MINVVCATNDAFAQHCAVMACSVLMNTKAPHNVKFFVLLTKELDSLNRAKLEDLFNGHGAKFEFILLKEELFAGLPLKEHLTTDAYSRIFFAGVKKSVDKFIYLDCDLIVEEDIADLWEQGLDGAIVSAVYDVAGKTANAYLGLNDWDYFNTGVMVIDANKFREFEAEKKAVEFLKKNYSKNVCCDQDVLNFVLCHKRKYLRLEWNVTTWFFIMKKKDFSDLFRSEYVDAKMRPKIIHFTPLKKPTQYGCSNPFTYKYFQYLKFTGFKFRFTFSDRINFVKKAMQRRGIL